MCRPPDAFIAVAMELAMVQTADRNGELVADLAAHGSLFGELEVMGVRRRPPADEAGPRGDKPEMVAIAFANRLGDWANLGAWLAAALWWYFAGVRQLG